MATPTSDTTPTPPPGDNAWVYLVVQDPGPSEQIVGQHDTDAEVAYIPVYLKKEDATQGLLHLALNRKNKYEIQAFIFSDVREQAADNRFLVYIIDMDGNVLQKLAP
jgi:hypothetical protein